MNECIVEVENVINDEMSVGILEDFFRNTYLRITINKF